jgi:hypothetical protein
MIRYTIYYIIWYDMIYMIWYDHIIWYDIFNCNWVATRWQYYSTHIHTNNTGNVTKQTIHRTTKQVWEQHKNFVVMMMMMIVSVCARANVLCMYVYDTDTRRLTTAIRSEKRVVRRFRRCANVYLHKPRQYSIAYYTPRLYGIDYCS